MSCRAIAIVDPVCPRPYASSDAMVGGLGGTEATIVRVAEGLDANVFQHNRTRSEGRYRPMSSLGDPETLIVLRDPKAASEVAAQHPRAKVVLWMHDLIEPGRDRARRLAAYAPQLADRRTTIVAVSEFHRRQIEAALASRDERLSVTSIYNPLREGIEQLRADGYDRDRLAFFSSPVKGLDFASFVLKPLRHRWPRMELLVARPEYAARPVRVSRGIVELGPLSQSEVLTKVAGALCCFCPNFEYPETFGLVLAESNAVGTPVIAHPVGAAPEVLRDPRQLIEVPRGASLAFKVARKVPASEPVVWQTANVLGRFSSFLDRIEAWRDGARPVVRARPEFALPNVLDDWRSVLTSR